MGVRAKTVLAFLAVAGVIGADRVAFTAENPHGHFGESQAPARVEVRSKDGRVSFPFTLNNNHVIVQASIAGKPVNLIVDTGMPMEGLMLYKNPRVAALDLPYEEGMRARVAGAGGEERGVDAEIVNGLTIDLGELRLSQVRAIVAPPLPGLADYHDGVIGASLFKNFVVGIDYEAKRITLDDPKSWQPPRGATAVPFKLRHNAPFVEVGLLDAQGRRLPATVVVDLGAGHPISLNLGVVEGLQAPEKTINAIVGLGVSGRLSGRVGRIAGLELGGMTLKDVVATFPDADVQRPGGEDYGGGNLGNQVLQRFKVAFDYQNKRMVLSPNKSFDRPFEWDMSGLWLQPDSTGALKVGFVVDKSPANGAGALVGDVVTRWNGRDISAGDLPTLRETLRQPDQQLDLTILRDGKPVNLTFKTARLV
ncbi:MAG TPA: aspartyl protease family protein [Candidatus Polarisedimenticolia bacterium]|nr:aspartyl protease family protein [Candidatus Polarisedimenticolia bacterium]